MKYLTSKKILTKAIMMAAFSVATFSFLPTQAAISMDAADKKALVEQRIENINNQSHSMIDKITKHPFVNDIEYISGDLQHDDSTQSATATSELHIALNEDAFGISSLNFIIDEKVDYSDELNQQDILARIDSELHLQDGSEAYVELTDEQKDEVTAFLKDIDLHTDLLEGTAFKTYMTIPAVTTNDDEAGIKFDGLSVETDYDEESFAKGVGDTHIDAKRLIVNERQQNIDYDAFMALPQEEQDNLRYEDYPMTDEMVEALNLQPFTADFKVTEDGVLSFESSPITMYFDNQTANFMIEKITGEGDIFYDEDLQQYLGKQHYIAHTVSVESSDLPAPIVFDSIEYIADLDRENDLFNLSGEFILNPQEDSLDALTQGMFAINSANIGFNMDNVSQNTIEQFTSLQGYAVNEEFELDDASKDTLESLLNSLSQDGASAGFDITLSTDKGDATIDSTLRMREDTDTQAWIEAFDNDDSDAIERLAQEDLFYDAKIVLPIAILDAVGMKDMAEMMAGPYIVKEGDDFTVHVENNGEGPMINGKAMAEIESGM